MQPPAGKLIKSCGKITNFYDKKEPSGPEVNPKSQTKIRNIAIFKMKALFEAIRHILAKFQDSENKESHDKTAFVNGLSWLFSYRSGETRTRGLLLPKQARYQLRNTPASGGTAAPPEYSISFLKRFVNSGVALPCL